MEPQSETKDRAGDRASDRIGAAFAELVEVMERLLGEGGCPWDREQTLESLKPYLLEETYEVLEALDRGDAEEHKGELGDLLFQVVFQAALREREGRFGIEAVCQGIVAKMRRRHPHVFGGEKVSGAEEVLMNWARLKKAEHAAAGRPRGALDGVPREAPALLRAQRLGEKAAAVGFDWPDIQGVRDKVDEELAELDQAIAEGEGRAIFEEMGDLLFTLTRLAAKLGVPPEDALRGAMGRFEARFRYLEEQVRSDGKALSGMSLDEMDVYWRRAKQALRQGPA
jgi:MazG family protein